MTDKWRRIRTLFRVVGARSDLAASSAKGSPFACSPHAGKRVASLRSSFRSILSPISPHFRNLNRQGEQALFKYRYKYNFT